MEHELPSPKVRELYTDLCMMRDRLEGRSYLFIAARWKLTPRSAQRRIKKIAYHMMLKAMENTKSDPDVPREAHFTLKEFNSEKGSPMKIMMHETLAKLFVLHPSFNGSPLGPVAVSSGVQSASGEHE